MFNFIFSKLNQMHKRKGFVFLGLSLLSILIAFVVVITASNRLDLIAKTGLLSVKIENSNINTGILGSGINLNTIPDNNMIDDSSFEPNVFKEVFLVDDGNKNTMFISNKNTKAGVYGSEFFNSANYRVMTTSNNGMQLKKQGKVISYLPNQIGTFENAPVIGDIPVTAKIRDYTSKDGQVLVVGDKGMIIKDINTQSPSIKLTNQTSNYTGVTSNSDSFFVCSKDGTVISTKDCEVWEKWTMPYAASLNAIAASERAVVAVGDKGVILTGFNGILYITDPGITDNITDITYGNNIFVAVTDKGNILKSENGITWNRSITTSKESFTKIEYSQNYYIILTSSKTLYVYSDLESQPVIADKLTGKVIDATIMSRGKILLLTSDNLIYESDNQGNSWRKSSVSPTQKCDLIGAIGDDEILSSYSFLKSYISKLVTKISVDSALKEGTFQAGDMCYLDIEYPIIPSSYFDKDRILQLESPWSFSGSGVSKKILDNGAPHDGVGVMSIESNVSINTASSYAVISQKILQNSSDTALMPGQFYWIELWAKQKELTQSSLKVWISGPFDPIGTAFENIGTTWKKYTFKFVIPPGISKDDLLQARLNIGTTQKGVFYIDKVYLAPSSENGKKIPASIKDSITSISPSFIRTQFLEIGTQNVMPDRWALNAKLDEALKFVSESGTNTSPWIVIDSLMGESEFRNFIEYLAGSISTTYGKIRMSNGTTLPWISSFDRILFEFIDTNNSYETDIAKTLAVNEYIRIMESSPYYKSIRNKIVIVDGMNYNDGTMLSRADYSASDFIVKMGKNNINSIREALVLYSTQIPRTPDRLYGSATNLMRSAFISDGKGFRLDEYITILIDSLGTDISASMLSMPNWTSENWDKIYETAAYISSSAAKGLPLKVSKTQIKSGDTKVDCYAYKYNNEINLVFASHSESPVAISLDFQYNLDGAKFMRFDSKGAQLEDTVLKTSSKQFNIMPYNVILIKISNIGN